MPEKRSKYDTDPLDPDFARNTEEVWGATRLMEDAPTEHLGGATRPVPPGDQAARFDPNAEAPTQRIDEKFAQSYPSVFVPPAYQPPRPPAYQQQTQPQNFAQQTYAPPPQTYASSLPNRNVSGLGIPEKWVTTLPYAPFKIGLVVSIIELLVVPRGEVRARTHAAQGLALQLGILAIQVALTLIALIGGGKFGGFLFDVAAFIFLIYSLVRVWRGDEYRIAPLADAVRWLNIHIDSKRKG
jgi:uncharacterized membrane protein